MRSLLSSVSIKIAQSPKVLRHCIGPISWRLIIMIATVMGWIQVSNKHPHIKFPANGLDSMYYSICAVYGVIAGFLITAMTIVVISDSVSAVSMRKRAQDSVPYKIIFAIVTLLFFALLIAFLGPFSARIWTQGVVIGSTIVVVIEFAIVVLLVLEVARS